MNNFVQRSLSGLVFVSLVVGSIFWHQYAFFLVFLFLTTIAVWEFHKLTSHQPEVQLNRLFPVIGAIILFSSSFLYAANIVRYPIFSIYGLYLVLVLIAELYRRKGNPIQNWAYLILGQVIIALPFALLNFIAFIDAATYNKFILVAVFAIIWINDTGAYVFGISFGKHRLFERISPKKSWEGFVGGALAALVGAYIFSIFNTNLTLIQWIIFAEIVVVFGTFGDLMESLLKRTVQVKDSGKIIPGHGGMLDRFDSMLLVAPVIFIYLSFIFR